MKKQLAERGTNSLGANSHLENFDVARLLFGSQLLGIVFAIEIVEGVRDLRNRRHVINFCRLMPMGLQLVS